MNELSGLRGPTNIQWHGQGYGVASYGADHLKNVLFYTRAVLNQQKSLDTGRPFHEPVDHIKIFDPAEPQTVIDRPIQEADKHRFNRQWSQFLTKKEQVPEGTPIEQLFPNNPDFAANLRGWGVYTVEQCANLSLNAIQSINMGAQEAQNRAKAYLDQAKAGVGYHKLQKDYDDLKTKYSVLQQNFNTLQAQFGTIMEKIADPNKNSNSPTWQPNYDAQAERLNTNHPSFEAAEKKKRTKKQVEAPVEQFEDNTKMQDSDTQY